MLTILRRVKEKSRKLISRYKSAIPFFIIVLFFEVIPIVNMISRSFLNSGSGLNFFEDFRFAFAGYQIGNAFGLFN